MAPRIYSKELMTSSTGGSRETGYLQARVKLAYSLHHVQKVNSKWLETALRLDSVKFLDKNTGLCGHVVQSTGSKAESDNA